MVNNPHFDDQGNYCRNCVQCEREFYFKPEEQEFYKKHGYDFPKRCWNCRQQRRKVKENKAAAVVYKPADPPPPPVSEFEKSWE